MPISFHKHPFFVAAIAVALSFSVRANTSDSLEVKAAATPIATGEAHTASENGVPGKEKNLRDEIREHIAHHVLDAHSFVLFSDSETGKDYGFPLPVILWDNGPVIFSSSRFGDGGHKIVESAGKYYRLGDDEKIYRTDASGTMLGDPEHPSNEKPFDFSITKGVLSMLVVAALMFWLFVSLAKSFRTNNGLAKGAGRFFEPVVLYVRDEIAIPNIGEKHYKKYMSYLLTIFFFIWFLNLFGLMPFGINVTGNIAITFGLAILTFLITNLTGNRHYWGHIFWMPGVPWLMKIILAPIELLGVIIKPFALMIRLYANIFAGHIVLMSLIGLMFIFKTWLGSGLTFLLSFGISMIEILVALLQAYIFTILTALYFGMAKQEHHDHAEDHAHPHPAAH